MGVNNLFLEIVFESLNVLHLNYVLHLKVLHRPTHPTPLLCPPLPREDIV